MKTYKVKNANIELTEEQVNDLIRQKEGSKGERFFFPKEGERAWYINNKGNSDGGVYESDRLYGGEIVARGVFRTKEQAKKEDEKRLALVRMWKWVQENGLFFEPDWSDKSWNDKSWKESVVYENNKWRPFSTTSINYNFLFPYFKTSSDCQKFIDNNLSDLNLFV
jgi:hypothetical protein